MMKKVLLLLLMAISFATTAQNYTIANPLKLNTVAVGTENDSVLMYSSQKVVKHLPLSEIKVPTNIDYLAAPSGGIIFSSTGTDASIPLGTTTNAGLMDPADKVKLNGLQTALDLKEDLANKNVANGYAGLGSDGKVDPSHLPTIPTPTLESVIAAGNTTTTGFIQGTVGSSEYLNTVAGLQYDKKNTSTLAEAHLKVNTVVGATLTAADLDTGESTIQAKGGQILLSSQDVIKFNTIGYGTANIQTGNLSTDRNQQFANSDGTYAMKVNGIAAGTDGNISLTNADIGLGNVNNTSDVNKPVSTATQTALNLKANDNAVMHLSANETFVGIKTANNTSGTGLNLNNLSGASTAVLAVTNPNGSTVPSATFTSNGSGDAITVRTQSSLGGVGLKIEASSPSTGKALLFTKTGTNTTWIENNGEVSAPKFIKTGATASNVLLADGSDIAQSALVPTLKTIESQSLTGSGNIDLNKSDVGLSNVDNISDINKPVSTATQTALDLKANIDTPTFTGVVTVSSLVSTGRVTFGTGSATAGSVANSSTSGTVLRGNTGSFADFTLKNASGSNVFRNLTGTSDVEFDGNIKVSGVSTASQYFVSTLATPPSSSTDTGMLGEIRITSTHIYVCIDTDTWVRTALATW